jgi:hypothetical protein
MQHFTVWRFESAISGEVVLSVRTSHVDDKMFEHNYQRIVWRGAANSAKHALDLAAAS